MSEDLDPPLSQATEEQLLEALEVLRAKQSAEVDSKRIGDMPQRGRDLSDALFKLTIEAGKALSVETQTCVACKAKPGTPCLPDGDIHIARRHNFTDDQIEAKAREINPLLFVKADRHAERMKEMERRL